MRTGSITKQGLHSNNVSSRDDVVTPNPIDLPQLVDVLAIVALLCHVGVGGDLAASDARKVRHNIKSEGTELLHVHTLALTQVVVQVGNQGSPDDLQLQV